MALAVCLKAIRGAARVRVATGAVVAIAVLLWMSDLSCSWNLGRGRLRSSLAMRTRGATSGSTWEPTSASGVSGRDKSCVMAWSSCSNRERSAIGTLQTLAKFFERAELQLFDGAVATIEFASDFGDGFLLHKTHNDHAALVGRQLLHQLKQRGLSLDVLHALVSRIIN